MLKPTHQREGVPLVGVEASLHQHDADPVEHAEEQAGLVPGHRRRGEVGDVLVREDVRGLQQVSQVG